MKLVCISDTHEQQSNLDLPDGDILVHAGDLTYKGSMPVLGQIAEWFKGLPFKHKIMIAGNHDFAFENANRAKAEKLFKDAGVTYLFNNSIVIDGVKFYGAPWQPWFHNWAFNRGRGRDIGMEWAKIPDDTNVLITHGPPYGILDLVEDNIFNAGRDLHQGCEELAKKVKQLPQLKAHIFGHLHLNGGQTEVVDGITFGNAAICTERYQPTNPPLVIEV